MTPSSAERAHADVKERLRRRDGSTDARREVRRIVDSTCIAASGLTVATIRILALVHERIDRENGDRTVGGAAPLRPPLLRKVRRRVRHLQPWMARVDDRRVADD